VFLQQFPSKNTVSKQLSRVAGGLRWGGVEYAPLLQDDTPETEDMETQQGAGGLTERSPILNPGSKMWSIHNRRFFLGSFLAVEIIGVTLVAMTIAWVEKYKGGVEWGSTPLGIAFNWHPILMTLSLIFLYGNGALIYRVIPPRDDNHKLLLKCGHAAIMLITFVAMVIGLQAAFDSHNYAKPDPKPNMYTLHSWIGLLAALLFGIQWALGFAAFLFPKFSADLRALVLHFHQFFGSSIIILAGAAAVMGHLEKAIWTLGADYGKKVPEANLVNCIGIFIVLFIMGVNFLITKFSKEDVKQKN